MDDIRSLLEKEAVEASVPAGTTELNLKAFHAGLDYFDEVYGNAKKMATT